MPISMAFIPSSAGGKLYVATGKGKGTGPNDFPQRIAAAQPHGRHSANTYIATLLYGSLAALDESEIAEQPAANGPTTCWLPIA